jgi:hypothetical protein
MARGALAIVASLVALLLAAPAATAQEPATPWDGSNPFLCELQYAGFGPTGPNPSADPYCVEFDKRRQNVSQLGVVEFLSLEPARVAAASDKCFYFQSDHWRGSIVQDAPGTKTYEWDGHYFFDKARGEGGVWVSNFNVNGQTGDPRTLPGFPESYKPYFGPGTGGTRNVGSVQADPRCAERAAREGSRIYAALRGTGGGRSACGVAGGPVSSRRLGPVRIGDPETQVRRSLGPPSETKRGFLRYCLDRGARYLVGQREDRSGEFGEGSVERTVMLVSSHSAYRYGGIGPGSSVRALRKRFRRARLVLRYEGGNRVYAPRRRRSAVLFGVRRRKVRFVAVRDLTAVRGKRGIRAFLRRAR